MICNRIKQVLKVRNKPGFVENIFMTLQLQNNGEKVNFAKKIDIIFLLRSDSQVSFFCFANKTL
jgi:hypothetical protein